MQPPAPHTSHKDTTLQTAWKISVHIFRKRNPLAASSSIFRIPQICTITKKGPPDLFVVCLATKNVRKILFFHTFYCCFFLFLYLLSLSREFRHNIRHMLHLFTPPCVFPAKQQCIIRLTLCCMHQRSGDTVWCVRRITGSDTLIAFFN